jgi:hypothetical protein
MIEQLLKVAHEIAFFRKTHKQGMRYGFDCDLKELHRECCALLAALLKKSERKRKPSHRTRRTRRNRRQPQETHA